MCYRVFHFLQLKGAQSFVGLWMFVEAALFIKHSCDEDPIWLLFI